MPTRKRRSPNNCNARTARLGIERQRDRLKRCGIEAGRFEQQIVRNNDGDGARLAGAGQLKRLPDRTRNVLNAGCREDALGDRLQQAA